MTLADSHRTTVVEVENLTAAYGDNVILEGVSFRIHEGERFIILGGSGCGKSTLLKYLIGLLPIEKGRITLLGNNLGDDNRNRQEMLKQIGVLFQNGALLGSMTLEENIALPMTLHTDLPESYISNLVKLKLAMVNLSGYENYLPSELSGGMVKRAALARAMALNPRILFFDEPSAGLDPVTSAELDELIIHLNSTTGTTMVIVTHELESIFNIGERVIMLDRERKGIIATGTPLELRDKSRIPYVRQFFNRKSSQPVRTPSR
ncbi:MAG: ATP-binding cassette domain-containing protein [Proteobacteria bacterium]|nr:ATP-binding cassette domain-containing protein [Pseudomonadota bacterium]MBU1739203.1 ATP-binding cassette domain-containing protein [Pseudomonadota bacterium]